MGYAFTELHPALRVERIVTVHYFQYSADFVFPGESHDFWEFLYVDRGPVTVSAGGICHTLTKDQIIFHRPGEFHTVRAEGGTPNLVVAAFDCASPGMDFFAGRVMRVEPDLRVCLQRMVHEAQLAFSSDLNDPMLTRLVRRPEPAFGSEQLIGIALEQLLIELHRRGSGGGEALRSRRPAYAHLNTDNQVFRLIVDYMERNLGRSLHLEDVCRDNLISRSAAQKLFREITGGGVMDYFNTMKIEYAKILIRERRLNFTQIAQALGYSSIHYLSRQFHQKTGMTLTQFSNSVL